MIVKKPYAFLIRHFRLIHGLLFGMLLYLAFKSFEIYSFFSSYASNHSYLNQLNLASNYVNPFMYIILIASILVLFIIYFILSLKDKSNKIYLASILYYIILIIFYIYMYTVFRGLEEKSLDLETVRFFKDISLIVVLPQIVLLFIIFGRTLGFNLKQFEFKKDLEELQIDVTDNEEVELTLGNDTYKIARSFRKFLRLTKYFLIENKLFVIAMSSIIILSLSIFIYSKLNVYQETYKENQNILSNGISYNIKESYITNTDINNEIISKGKSYILVNIDINNTFQNSYKLSRELFKLKIGNEMLMPVFNVSNRFFDIGNPFEIYELKGGENKNYLVIFEINDSDIENDYLFKIKDISYNQKENNNYYKDIIIKPININNSMDKGSFKLPNKITMEDTILKNSSLQIDSYDIADRFREPYKYTINNKEKDGIYSIMPSETNKGSVTILKIKANLSLDSSTYVSSVIKDPGDFFSIYALLRYRYQGNYITSKLEKIDNDFDKQNYSYLEIPSSAKEANKIDLIILIRGVKYTFNLK